MTLHIDYNHQCPRCGALYIPYGTDVACPQCGHVEKERFDFIPKAADSALHNLRAGSFIPGSWWVGSFGDHVLHILFMILERHRTGNAEESFETVARRFVDAGKWGNQLYAKEHIFQLACDVHQEINKRPPLPPRMPRPPETRAPKRKKWWPFSRQRCRH